jgi:hypothetical protein
MAIRSSGALGIREILNDIDGDVSSRADLIGLGVIVGASAGVIGGGDNVIMPGDFYGEDISLTATTISASPTSHAFSNTGGEVTITISSNGIFRLSNVPSWAFVTPTYGASSTTSLIIAAGGNSALGSAANPSSTIQLLGSSNSVLASITISQAGNPVTFEWVGGSEVVPFTAGTFSKNVSAAEIFTLGVTSSNTSLATVSIGTATGTNPKSYPITITHFENFQSGSDEVCQLTATGTASAGTITKQISMTQTAYDPIRWLSSSSNLSDDGGTVTASFTGATSVNATSGGHPFTISFYGGTPSWISSSVTSGTYSPTFKAAAGETAGTTSVVLTFSANTTGATRSTVVLVTDTNSGHITSLNLTQAAQELSTFDIDSGESDPHILNLPAKADLSVGTFTLQLTANTGYNNDWNIVGYESGTDKNTTGTPPRNYDTSELQHQISTDSTWTAITTALTGNGNATINVRNPDGYWSDFDDAMEYPYYRFKSASYPSDYTQTVTIKQPKPPIDFDLTLDADASQYLNALAGNGDTELVVYCNSNSIGLNVYGVNSTGLTIGATIALAGNTANNLFTTTTSYASSNWITHPNSTQTNAGRPYSMTFTITNNNTSTSSITSQQWVNLYVKGTTQSQSEGQTSGGYSKIFIEQSSSGGGGTPPGGPSGPPGTPPPGGVGGEE